MSFKKCPLCGEFSFFRNYCYGFIGKSRWECKSCGKTLGFSKKRSKTISAFDKIKGARRDSAIGTRLG